MRYFICSFAFALILVSVSASTVCAQDERVRLSGTASLAVGDGGPAPALSVTGGFQLAPHAGFELEALYVPDQQFGRNDMIVQGIIFPVPRVDIDGRTVAFLSSFVTDLQVGRLRPYALFGGGIANVRRKVAIDYPPQILSGSALVWTSTNAPIGVNVRPIPVPIPRSVRTTVSENDLVFTTGAGLDIRIWKRLSVAADVRYLHLFQTAPGSDAIENITRIGARAAYWF